MKRITILSVFILFSSILFSQAWESLLPKNKVDNGTLTFKDYQNTFNTYWEPYNVDNNGYFMQGGEKHKAYGWKQFKRWEWYMGSRVNPITGEFPKTNDKIEWENYLKKYPENTKNLEGNWTNIGIDNSSGGYNGIGRLNCIAFHPNDPNRYWVGAPYGGIWATYDDGNTWTVLNDNEWNSGVSTIAIPSDYTTSHTIYIGTGDRDQWDNLYGSSGVMKSVDGGNSWIQTELQFNLSYGNFVNEVFIHPGDYVYAATTNGLYISANEGENWTIINSLNFIDVEMLPSNTNTMYAATKSNPTKIYVSTNAGVSWQETFSATGLRTELATSPQNPNKVYAAVVDTNGGLHGIYSLTYPETSFTMVFDGTFPNHNILDGSCDGSEIKGQGGYDLCMAANPNNANEIILGGVNTWKSTDGGYSWDIINHRNGSCNGDAQYAHADKHFLAYQPFTNYLFECNDGGLLKSYNQGESWTDISNGLNISEVYRIANSSTSPDEMLAGLQDCGSKNLFGGQWVDRTNGDGMDCLIDYTNNNIQYTQSQHGNTYRTLDHWQNSINIKENLPEPDSGAWTTPMCFHPTSSEILFIGYTNLWRSMDKGNSFTKISAFGDDKYIEAINISNVNTQLYVVGKMNQLWKSVNAGAAWQDITSNLPVSHGRISSIECSYTETETIWITITGYNQSGVWETIDGGLTWSNISSGLPYAPAFSVIQNQLANNQEIYVATTLGIFIKIGTNVWIPFNNGLASVPVHEVEIYYDGANSKIRAATWGRGIWESDLFSYESNTEAVWTGTKSADWFDGDNWQYGVVPGDNNDVVIPISSPWPVINGGTANCNSLTIETGATLEVVHYLDVNGDFNVSGEIIMSGSNPDIDIVGNVYFKDGSTADIQFDNASINIEGHWTFEENSDAQLEQGTVVFSGPSGKSIKNFSEYSSFNNITISKNLGAYIYFSNSSTYDLKIQGNFFTSVNCTYRQYSELNTIIEGSLYNYGTILGYAGGIELNGTGSGINSNGNSYFNNLILSGGTNSINDDLEVRGDLIFNGGTLNCNNHSISIEGNWDNNSDLNAFIPGNGSVIFEGDDGQSITGSISFNVLENNISSGYIDVIDDVFCNSYDWTNGGIRVDHDNYSSFIAMDLADNAIYGDFILDHGNIELHSSGWVHLCGNITINGGDFDVHGGTTNSYWPGFVDASLTMSGGVMDFKDMGINIKSSALSLNLDITGGEIKTIGSFYDYRGEFNPTGGEVTLYGQYNAYIDCISGSYFYDLNIDKESVKGKNKSPKSISVSLWRDTEVTNTCVIDKGEFDINGKTIYVDGLFSVKGGGTLVMIDPADSINAGYFWWNPGSMANITEGEIVLRHDWVYVNGTLAELSGTNRLILNGSDNQTIKVYEEEASFSSIRIEKTGGSVYTDADYLNDIYIKNNLHIISEALYFNEDNVDVEGSVYIGSSASLFINNGTTIEAGHNINLGTVEVSNSDVVVNQSFNQISTGILTINDTSSFILEKPYDGSFMNFGGTVELNGGFLEVTHYGMEIVATSNIIFNGGDLKLGGNLTVPSSGAFNPSQGSVEFIGSSDSWVNMVAGNSFHNLVINKGVSNSVVLDSEITINNDLIIQSGELKAESNTFEAINIIIEPQGILNPQAGDITISGNWTNNHGTDGFIENNSQVTFIDFYYDSHILSDEVFHELNIEKSTLSGSVTLPDGLTITVQNFNINSGKFITGGNLKIGGNFDASISGTFLPSQGFVEFIEQDDAYVNMAAGNYFKDLIVNKPNFGQLELLSELDIRNDLHIISGELMTDGYNVEAIDISIDPIGILNSDGSSFTIKGNWANHAGDDGFIEDGSHVTFTDHYYQSNIFTNETFNQVVLNKGSSNGELILADNTNINFNQLELNSGKLITGNNNNITCDNDGYIASNASLIMPDASPSSTLVVAGEFSHDNNGFFEIGSGNDVAISQFLYDAQLTINGGNLDCTSSWWMGNGAITNLSGGSLVFSNSTPTWLNLNGTLTMTGGTIDAQLNSISFNQNFNGNFSGGTITTGGSLNAQYDNIFQQNGGEVFFTGDADSTLFMADGCYVNDFTMNKTGGTLTILSDLQVANNFTLNSGYFDKSVGTLSVGRNWANYAGPSSINLSGGTVQFISNKPATILTDETFNALFIDKPLTDGNYLDVADNKIIQVNKHFIAKDGMLRLNDNCFLGVEAMFQLQDGAGICIGASTESATLRINGDWDNQNTTNSEFSGFFANTSTVIFDGSNDQDINGASFEENFYNLIIEKPSGELKPNVNMSISNDIVVEEGIWTYGNTGLYYDLYGNLIINPNGSWQDDQNLLVFSSGDNIEFTNNSTIGSLFGDININLGEATTNLQINADFSCTSLAAHKGIINMDNMEVSVSDWIVIYDEAHMEFTNASILKMGSSSDITVSGGLLSFAGNESNTNLLTRESAGHYSFNISDNGRLNANYTTFEFMDADGVHIHNTGLLTGANPLQNCAFQNGETGGTLLNVENSQELVITESIFPTNTSGGLYNVSKSNNDGSLTFIDASGDFSGEGFENDNYNRVDWEESAIRLNVKAYLEGPFDGSEMQIQLNNAGLLPLSQPYNQAPWNYSGLESVVTIPANVVDWVLVELRDAPDAASSTATTMIEQRAAFLLKNGNIVDLDGSSIPSFNHSLIHSLFVVVWQRNHLPVLSANALQKTGEMFSYDFSISDTQAFGSIQNELSPEIYGMIGGDINADQTINENDLIHWKTWVGKMGYLNDDTNLDGQINNKDKNDIWLPNYGKTVTIPE